MHSISLSWQIILLNPRKRACGSSDTSLIIRRGHRTYRFSPYSVRGILRRVYAFDICSGTLSAPRKVAREKRAPRLLNQSSCRARPHFSAQPQLYASQAGQFVLWVALTAERKVARLEKLSASLETHAFSIKSRRCWRCI